MRSKKNKRLELIRGVRTNIQILKDVYGPTDTGKIIGLSYMISTIEVRNEFKEGGRRLHDGGEDGDLSRKFLVNRLKKLNKILGDCSGMGNFEYEDIITKM